MPIELPDKKTPVTNEGLIEALWYAWIHCFDEVPKKEAIHILIAQWALETGWGKSMHNFNLGNAKSRDGDGFDYSYFKCNEIIATKTAEQMQRASPSTAKISSYRSDGYAVIWFMPKHPGCRFRAFNTLLEGAIDHINLVHKRFARSWPALLSGDPEAYAVALRSQGYYTADVHTPQHTGYADILCSLYKTASKIPFDYTELNSLTDKDKERISASAAISIQGLVDETMEEVYPSRDFGNTEDES